MQKLLQYIKSHKSLRISAMLPKYLSQDIQEILRKYKFTFEELCYRLKHNISLDKEFVCKYCGKHIKFDKKHYYNKFCDVICMGRYYNETPEIIEKRKQTCLKKYGVDTPSKSEKVKEKCRKTCIEKYGVDNFSKSQQFQDMQSDIQQKTKQTCKEKFGEDSFTKTPTFKLIVKQNKDEILEKRKATNLKVYGFEFAQQSEKVKEKQKNTCLEKFGEVTNLKTEDTKNKSKQTCLRKYKVEHYSQSDDFKTKYKRTMQAKYKADNYFKTEEFKGFVIQHSDEIEQKKYNTRKKNNTTNTSSAEKRSINLLKTKFDDVVTHYKSDFYPFNCDVYIPSLDLYIEFNYHWTHGEEPFDKDNAEHLSRLKFWKDKSEEINFKGEKKSSYIDAIKVWTVRDPLKFEIAKKNNLNYKVFYTKTQFLQWFNSYMEEAGELPAPEGGGDLGDILSGLGG